MTEKDLFREIGNINEKYIAEAEQTRRAVIFTPVFRRTLATAACLVVCFGLYFGVRQLDLGAQNETASVQSNGMSSTQTESMVMDSASNSVAGEAANEDEMFWEGFWPLENETTADTSEKEYTTQTSEGKAENIQESTDQGSMQDGEQKEQDIENDKVGQEAFETVGAESVIDLQNARNVALICEHFDGYAQNPEHLPDEVVVLNEAVWLQSGKEAVDTFLEQIKSGQDATLELIKMLNEEESAFYYIHYNGENYYLLTDWRYSGQSNEVSRTNEDIYAYLKVFEEPLEDGTMYYTVGLGEQENFTLYDLQIGTRGTLAILRCMK